MTNLVAAVLKVMEQCKGVDKSMTVGSGNSSYKGVSDKDVKLLIGQAMRENGLIILPTKIEPKTTITTYDTNDYRGNPTVKQTVFTEVLTTYTIMHTSGESMEVQGYGHGTDPQDKAAGKATTYALKYALLYTFLVATGHIDDTDNTHSDEIPTPPAKPKKEASPKGFVINADKPILTEEQLNKCIEGYKKEESKAKVIEFLSKKKFTDQHWQQITATAWGGGDTFNG